MEHEQKLTEQQRTALSQLETLRSELHRVVDERVDGNIHRILLGGVLVVAPTLPLTASSAAFKGEKPESILFPGGRQCHQLKPIISKCQKAGANISENAY